MVPLSDDDFRQAVDAVAGLANGIAEGEETDEERAALVEPTFLKFHGAWAVERNSLKAYIQQSMEEPWAINSAMKRLVEERCISEIQYTTRDRKGYRLHGLNRAVSNNLAEELWKS